MTGNKTLYVVSLGCDKNFVDTERALGMFVRAGFAVVDDPARAEVILVNTCGFIEPAVRESLETIAELALYKKSGACRYLIMTGCVPQRYRAALADELPEVDAFLGVRDYPRLQSLIALMLNGQGLEARMMVGDVEASGGAADLWDDRFERVPTGLAHSVYVKISEGCARRCTFCAIPGIRGGLVSRPMDAIIKEIQFLEARGAKEVHLIAHALNDYKNGDLTSLVENILDRTAIQWIRLHYLYPADFSDRFLDLFQNKRLCPYLDIPIQHIDDHMLKRMGRGYDGAFVRGMIERLRARVPDLALRTTLIVAFPEETEACFARLLSFVEEGWIEHLGVFPYYHEAGTPAHAYDDAIPIKEKMRRQRALERAQSRVMDRLFKSKYLHRQWPCIIDGAHPESDDLLKGRLSTQALAVDPFVTINEGRANSGAIVNVSITAVKGGMMIGRIVKN